MSQVLGRYKTEESDLGVTMLQWIPFDSGGLDTNIIPHTISPRASLLHSFQCLWAHNPYNHLQRTILSSRKNETTLQFPVAFVQPKTFQAWSFFKWSVQTWAHWDSTTSSMDLGVLFGAPRLRPKELQPYLPTTDLPSQTNRPMPWYATMPMPSLHSCYEFVVCCFRFSESRAVNWNEILQKFMLYINMQKYCPIASSEAVMFHNFLSFTPQSDYSRREQQLGLLDPDSDGVSAAVPS